MQFILSLLLIAYSINALVNPNEATFICQYDGLLGFPVPCANASNACAYTGIICQPQNDTTWNQTITELSLFIYFSPNTTNAIPTQIGNLASLQKFELNSYTQVLQSSIPTQIGLCTQLSYLSLGLTLGGSLPSELFLGASQLALLNLPGNGLTGTVPTSLSHARDLNFLALYYNQLSGTFPLIALLSQLTSFDISLNLFTGILPDASSLSSLESYNVANNQFSGDTPLFNSSNLTLVDLSHNLLDGTLSPVYGSLSLSFSANANELKGTIPSELFGPTLSVLDIAYNHLSGTLPSEILLSQSLSQLDLSHNGLSGSLSPLWSTTSMPLLFKVLLNHNAFTGSIPSFMIGANVTQSNHIYLNLNDNMFSGDVPSFSDFPLSSALDLSNNGLTLEISSFGNGGNISWLKLSANPITQLPGLLFGDIWRFKDLKSLDLSHCQISGTLPEEFHVQYLQLNNNYFTGTVPQLFIYTVDASQLPVFVDIRLNRLSTDATRDSWITSVGSEILGDIVISDYPQDVDECGLNISECEFLCIDGWFPVPGYTCACPSGYALDPINKRNCSTVCGDGLLKYPEEECDYVYSPWGCNFNCTSKPGYLCGVTGCSPICGDGLVLPPEECDFKGEGCTAQCTAVEGYTCSTQSNTCQTCAQEWQPFIYPPNLALFPTLRSVIGDLSPFNFTACVACTDGFALETRVILADNTCLNMSTQRSLPCSFACSNLTVFRGANDGIFTLQNELMRGDFIIHLFRALFNVNLTLNTTLKKRDALSSIASLNFNLSPCNIDTTGMSAVLQALSTDIVPNLPLFTLNPIQCGLQIQSTDVTQQIYLSTGIIVGAMGLLLVLAFFATLYYYYRQSELHALPHDISWSFLDQWTHPWRWEYHGSSKSGYYARTYETNSKEYQRVNSLFVTHFKKGQVQIARIIAIYNRALSVSFVNQWKLMTTRKIEAPDQFFQCTFMKDEAKVNIMKYYQDNLLQFTPYNHKLQVPLLPVLHGTDFLIAEKIAQTGFASLSTLDPGYYGKGIYFTTSLPYTLTYSCGKRRPAVIISYINMGNIYPVTEHHKGPYSIKGQALKSGYNSHLVLTDREGFIYDESRNDIVCDEIVVNQESQILPAFLVELDIDSCQNEYNAWIRDIPLPMNDAALQHYKVNDPPSIISIEDTFSGVIYDL